MFQAYSLVKKEIVDINDSYDVNEVFLCPNPHCTAKFIIKSPDGKIKKHFSRKPSTPHSKGCFYDLPVENSKNFDNFIKTSIEEIFISNMHNNYFVDNEQHSLSKKYRKDGEYPTYIRTTKQLLNFCVSNKLETKYLEEFKVKDILLDSRNIAQNRQAEGISGLRLLLGETSKRYYCTDEQSIYFHVTGYSDSKHLLTLHVTVKIPDIKYFNQVKKYLYTGDNSRNPLAVLGDWTIDSKYNVSCILNGKRNLIYRLKNKT